MSDHGQGEGRAVEQAWRTAVREQAARERADRERFAWDAPARRSVWTARGEAPRRAGR